MDRWTYAIPTRNESAVELQNEQEEQVRPRDCMMVLYHFNDPVVILMMMLPTEIYE